ncbi:MAG: DinB family protein [Gemmatimonadales bacterium]
MEIRTIGPFLDYWSSVRGRTRKVIADIPPDKIDWSHSPTAFTLGDLGRHLATIERYMYAETVAGRPSSYPGCERSLAPGKDDVIAFMDRLDAESIAIFATLTDEDIQKKCVTPAGVSITLWKWLRAMVEHEAHHRGQIFMMLAMLGVKSRPLYGLTEEEVRARSISK